MDVTLHKCRNCATVCYVAIHKRNYEICPKCYERGFDELHLLPSNIDLWVPGPKAWNARDRMAKEAHASWLQEHRYDHVMKGVSE